MTESQTPDPQKTASERSEIEEQRERLAQRKQRTAVLLSGVVASMVALSFAAVPLYDLFCRVTGFGGTTQVAVAASEEVREEMVTVRFNSNVSRGLPWDFRPEQRSIDVHLGEQALVFYTATNTAEVPTVGTATFNVTPYSAGQYFQKIHCFCFDRQMIEGGETVDFGVSFFVDPAILDDPDARDAKTITLSYTYFPHPDQEKLDSRPQTAEAASDKDASEISVVQ